MNFSRFSRWALKNTCAVQKHFTLRSLSCSNPKSMRFVQYNNCGDRGLGVQINGGASIVSLNGADETIPVDMVSYLHCDYPIEKVEK